MTTGVRTCHIHRITPLLPAFWHAVHWMLMWLTRWVSTPCSLFWPAPDRAPWDRRAPLQAPTSAVFCAGKINTKIFLHSSTCCVHCWENFHLPAGVWPTLTNQNRFLIFSKLEAFIKKKFSLSRSITRSFHPPSWTIAFFFSPSSFA